MSAVWRPFEGYMSKLRGWEALERRLNDDMDASLAAGRPVGLLAMSTARYATLTNHRRMDGREWDRPCWNCGRRQDACGHRFEARYRRLTRAHRRRVGLALSARLLASASFWRRVHRAELAEFCRARAMDAAGWAMRFERDEVRPS